jgi:hypothetical protein
MLQRLSIMAIVIFLWAAAAAVAESNAVDGRWEATINTPNGDMTLTFTFKAEDTRLTGTVETPNGSQPISDGKIDGSKLSFNTQFGGDVVGHQGTVSGDTIELNVKGPWGESQMTLKRLTGKKAEK